MVTLSLTDASAHDRRALQHIVQRECAAFAAHGGQPAPCLSLTALPDGRGYAVLPDRKGGAHLLLIALGPVGGIESPALLRPDSINYFEAAWEARPDLDDFAGMPVPRWAVGLAINSRRTRSQDRLHIHIACQGQMLHSALANPRWPYTENWTAVRLGQFEYFTRQVSAESLDGLSPFRLLAAGVPGAAHSMGDWTLLAAGVDHADGPSFVLLAGRGVPGTEGLLDSRCDLLRNP